MKYIIIIFGIFLVAMSNVSGYCQDQTLAVPLVATVNIAKIQEQSTLKVKFDKDLHTLADQAGTKYKQQIQNTVMTENERKLLGEQLQAQLNEASIENNAAFTQAVKEAIAAVAQKRGFELVLTDKAINLSDKDQTLVTVYNTASSSIVALAHTGIDITDDVIRQLNQQPINTLSTASNASPSHVVSASVVLNGEGLNQAFRLTAEQLNQAIDKGKQLAQQGKTWDDIYKTVVQMPRGVKGEKGKSHESAVYCTTLNAVDLTAAAYQAANNYDPLPPRYSQDGYAKRIHFFVSLVSVPKVGTTVFDHDRIAGVDDVQVSKFVLTDDKGNIFNPLNATSADGVQSGTLNFSGVDRLNHTDTSQTNAYANAYAYDSYGNSANAYATGTSTTTRTWTEYLPWSESHPYFSATYNVDFPLFDANGQPLIKTDAKSITLHIITPNGEKQATYDLQPPKI